MVREQEYAATRREARRRKKLKKLLNFDYTLLLIVIFILAFGLVMLYSTSAYAAALKTGNSAFYLKKQLFAACLGFVGMFFFTKIDYRRWAHLTFTFYIVSIILCISVIFIGTNINGQSRWLTLGPINIQPSEIGKVAVIMLLANTIDRYPKVFRTLKGVVWTLGVYACPLVAVVAYNNLSTAIIILGIAFIMAFVASPKYWYFLAAFGVSFLVIIASIPLVGYRADRINAWLHPEDFISDTGYQTLQGLYAIGSGGLFGKGLGESMQKYIVPEAQNDIHFAFI